ncbi:MAG: hypothetical protein E7Z89_05010 [Cyanobacteria bacterium SIG28]|nr:hypothetical protein [Cyanobacteria bacterium SIG28]
MNTELLLDLHKSLLKNLQKAYLDACTATNTANEYIKSNDKRLDKTSLEEYFFTVDSIRVNLKKMLEIGRVIKYENDDDIHKYRIKIKEEEKTNIIDFPNYLDENIDIYVEADFNISSIFDRGEE